MIKNKKIHSYKTIILIILIIFNCITQNGCNNKKYPNGIVKIFFCGQYLSDSSSEKFNVIKEFEQQFGIKVYACQTFDSNEQLYAKLKYSKMDFDVILPSDYMVSKLIQEDMLQELNKNKLSNYSEIDSIFKGENLGFDPTNAFSVPYTWGNVVIVYNEPIIEELTKQKAKDFIKGFDCLFNEKLKNEILMFSNSKDSFAIAQKALNRSINTTDTNEIKSAAKLLKKQKKLVQIYGVDEITDKMINNEAAVAPAFSSDAINMVKENKNLQIFQPKKTIGYVDNMCITKNSKNVENAHKFIDFMCRTKIAIKNCEFSYCATTINSAWEKLKPEIKHTCCHNKDLFKYCEIQQFLDEKTEQLIANLWEQIKI